MSNRSLRIGFVCSRLSGLDGVSLETRKWAEVLSRMGHEIFYIGGSLDAPSDRCRELPLASIDNDEVKMLQKSAFSRTDRPQELSSLIEQIATDLQNNIRSAVSDFEIDVLIAENVLTIPMHLPLGVALSRYLIESRLPCIAHHHDFHWERERFLTNCVQDYLASGFPPALDDVVHVCINRVQARSFARRTGCRAYVIPNVMDFASGPPAADQITDGFLSDFDLEDDRWLLVQPTRIVTRKNIETAVELAGRLGRERCQLFISHTNSDGGDDYQERILELAEIHDADLTLADGMVADERGTSDDGQQIYALQDVYHAADFVTFPSDYEGFGNAFLESILHRRPLFSQRFSVYRTDIEPYQFQVETFDEHLTDEHVKRIADLLDDKEQVETAVEANYRTAEKYLSFERLEADLSNLLRDPGPLFEFPKKRQPAETPDIDAAS